MTPLEKARKWCRRNPVVAGLATLLGLALVGGLLTTLWQLQRAEHFLNTSQDANQRLTESLARREQREAEAQLKVRQYPEAFKTLARLVHENPSNTLARARLFSALAGASLPWPILPPLRHEAEVRYGAFAPDSSFILTASLDGLLHVWNPASAERRFTLPHDTARGGFAMAPDGSRVATLATNGSAEVWQLPAGPRLFEIRHPASVPAVCRPGSNFSASAHIITAVAFKPDGTLLATVGTDGRACLWRMSDGQLEAAFEHGEPLDRVLFQPRGQGLLTVGRTSCRLLETSSHSNSLSVVFVPSTRPTWAEFDSLGDQFLTVADRTIEIWDARTGRKLSTLLDRHGLNAATFSPDGKWVVAANDRRNVTADRIETIPHQSIFRHDGPVNSVRFRPGDSLFLSASDDGSARLWSLTTGGRRTEPMQHGFRVNDALFDPHGRKVLTLSADGTARLWFVLRLTRVEIPLPVLPVATRLGLSPDGGRVAAAGPERTVMVIATRDLRVQRTETIHPAPITSFAFDAEAQRLASGDEAGQVRVTDLKTGRQLGEAMPHHGAVRSMRWSSNVLAVVTTTNVALWNIHEGPLESPVLLPGAGVRVLDFSPDGSRLILAGGQSAAQLYDPRTGKPVGASLAPPGEVQQVRFSPDGKLLATGGRGRATRVWDGATGQPVTPFLQPGAVTTWVAFSPDSRTLLTGSADGTLCLWDAHTGATQRDFLRVHRGILSAEFSPDGDYIVVSDTDRWVSVYHLESALPVLQSAQFNSTPLVRFSRDGRQVCVTTQDPAVALIKMPTVAAPQADLLLAMTELFLGKRLNEHGGWQGLDPEEFFARQRVLNDAKWRLGPDPQIRLYR